MEIPAMLMPLLVTAIVGLYGKSIVKRKYVYSTLIILLG